MAKTIAVKELAYFVCQSGDLTTEFFSNHDLEAGKKAHEHHQAKYNEASKKEVYIKSEITYLNQIYTLHGFIDGVLNIDGKIIIEEIKSTLLELDEISLDYHKEHLAQLKIYAYLYAINNNLDEVNLRLTYISAVDYLEKSFDLKIETTTLEEFVFSIFEEYVKWLNLLEENSKVKEETIASIKFPFKEKREGQQKLMKGVYQTLLNSDILYAIAPTGIGKTMATLFSALKTLKNKDKLFYLTAKGSGKNAPLEAIELLSKNGLRIKTIDITAKRKICNCNKKNCNPDECPFAIGYFSRLKTATIDIFSNHDIYSRDLILEIANKHTICAFEFSLYLSYFCDVVIADYNYVFDPKAHLIRYFEDDTYKPKVLVDEAHNLISRSKEMYSATINENDIRLLRRKLSSYKPSARNLCNKAIEIFEKYNDYLTDKALYVSIEKDNNLNKALRAIKDRVDEILTENKTIKDKDEILDVYFKILDFLRIADLYSTTHRLLGKVIDDAISISYNCLDASTFILNTINESIYGITFFSATLYPIKYYMDLLTKGFGNFINLPSPFDPNNLKIIINKEISTKYNDRENSVDTIIEAIESLAQNEGNYIIFFPSYAYLKMVYEKLEEPNFECILQKNNMTEDEKDEIIEKFKTTTNTKFGFFVMGGVFSEGIDFIGDALSGVIIVGVGLPLVCDENNILKDYFEEKYPQKGFDYAYMYPGFTKVIQAVGRVIRDENDRGVAILMDNRFIHLRYQELMPNHWKNIKVITNNYSLKKELKK